jgi:hypothetical protein
MGKDRWSHITSEQPSCLDDYCCLSRSGDMSFAELRTAYGTFTCCRKDGDSFWIWVAYAVTDEEPHHVSGQASDHAEALLSAARGIAGKPNLAIDDLATDAGLQVLA